MKVFLFKPSNECLGKFNVGSHSHEDIHSGLREFYVSNPSIPLFSYLEADGQTWTIVSLEPIELQPGRVCATSAVRSDPAALDSAKQNVGKPIPAFVHQNDTKQRYIQRIRAETAYPAFRLLVSISTVINYIGGAILIMGGLVIVLNDGKVATFFTCLMVGAFVIAMAKPAKESLLMLADLVDSVTDSNSRREETNGSKDA